MMSSNFLFPSGFLALVLAGAVPVAAQVRISEIMYHPSSERPAEEFVELWNTSPTNVALAGWRLAGGIDYSFGNQSLLPGSRVVVAADVAQFQAKYPGIVPLGNWTGTLGNSRNTVRLEDAAGRTVDKVTYADEGDWAIRQRSILTPEGSANGFRGWAWFASHDGKDFNAATGTYEGGRSLELINQAVGVDSGQNWGASAISNGTPGSANSIASANTAPLILEVAHFPAVPKPGEAVTVTARILAPSAGVGSVQLNFRNHSVLGPPAFGATPMFDDGAHGDGLTGDGLFGAIVPAQTNGTVIEFFVRAQDTGLRSRTWPAPARQLDGTWAQTCNALFQVDSGLAPAAPSNARQPFFRIICTETERQQLLQIAAVNHDSNAELNCTFVSVDGTGTKVRYNCAVRLRGEGSRGRNPPPWRVNIPTDRSWNELTAVNFNSQWIHSQLLGSAFALSSGLPVAEGRPVQVRLNGANYARSTVPVPGTSEGSGFGAYAMFEPINNEFAAKEFPLDPNGNVYRASIYPYYANLAYEGTDLFNYTNIANGGYTKTSNKSENDWSDLIHLTYVLSQNTPDASYAAAVSNRLNVVLWLRYFAVCNLLEYRETSMANGLGDDYAMYRGIEDPRFVLLGHDFDTILGQGDYTGFNPATSIWLMLTGWHGELDSNTQQRATYLFRMLRHPEFAPIYFSELKRLCDTGFHPDQFGPLLEEVLGGWVPASTIDNIRTFAAARRTSVLSQLPLTFSVNVPLPVSGGYYRTASPSVVVDGSANAIETRQVKVNGGVATYTAWQGRWTNAVSLYPGLNNLHVQCLGPGGTEVASTNVTVWYDDASVQAVDGVLAASTTWSAGLGPYQVLTGLTIPAGVTLTILPGTTVYLGSGANIVVQNGGRLLAQGTGLANIRFASVPGSGAAWGGLTINGAVGSPETRIAYATFEGNGATCIQVTAGTLYLDHSTFLTTTRRYLSLDGASFVVSDCHIPSAAPGALFELVHGTQGIKAGGRGIFLRNYFGVANSVVGNYNDVIDFTGGNRDFGQSIVQFYDNVFIGSSDDLIDLDGTDAWIEGNVFLNTHRNGSPDSASAVSGGNSNADTSEITLVRNFFFNCDHAATAKQGNFYTLLNNTIVHMTRTGGIDTASAVVNLADDGTTAGAGFYLEGNVITDVEALTRNYPMGAAVITFSNNVLPTVWSGPGGGNVIDLPRFKHLPALSEAQFGTWKAGMIMRDWLNLAPGSPGTRTGIAGMDQGAGIPGGVSISGPAGKTAATAAEFRIGTVRSGNGIPAAGFPLGSGYTHYQWRLDAGAWSGDVPLTQPLLFSGLSAGLHRLEVRGRRDSGGFQDAAELGSTAISPTLREWTIDPGMVALRLNEVLARNSLTLVTNGESPDLLEIANTGAGAVSLAGLGLTDNPSEKYKYAFPSGTVLEAGQYVVLYSEGSGAPSQNLAFALNANGGEVCLFDSAANGGALLDRVAYGPQLADHSIGRIGEEWHLCAPTFGAANRRREVGNAFLLKLNEWLAEGNPTMPDDFVEIYNPDFAPVDLGGLFLTDAPNGAPNRHPIVPLSFINARGWLAFKADGNTNAGPEHLNFKLSAEQGQLGLFSADLRRIDQLVYGAQALGYSEGRSPDGAASIEFFSTPTPGSGNPGAGGIIITNLVTTIDLVPITNVWRVNISGALPAANWKETDYVDTGWPQGRGLLGYEPTAGLYPYPFMTILPLSNGITPIVTYYFRTTFEAPTNMAGFVLEAAAFLDDGAIFYLNGVEVARLRMPAGPIVHSTLATNQPSEGAREIIRFNGGSLNAGTNWLAVEVHQSATTSSDVAFGLALSATRTTPVTNFVTALLSECLADNTAMTNADGTITDWVELYNPSSNTFVLADCSLSDDPAVPRRWVFPAGATLASGSRLTVRCDSASPPTSGNGPVLNTGFGLNSAGDAVYFYGPSQTLIDAIAFGPQAANFSIARVPDWETNWVLALPSAGAENVAATLANPAAVRINEWAASVTGAGDWFEIYNPQPQPVSLSGLYLTDKLGTRNKHLIPALTFVGTGTNGYMRFVADNDTSQGPNHVGFALDIAGEAIGLFPAGTDPAIDSVTFGPQASDVSEGRFPDGASSRHFFSTPSPAAANWLPLANVAINEVLTHTDLPLEDAVELRNLSSVPVDISGWFLSDQDTDLHKYQIPTQTLLPGNGYLVFYEAQFNSEPGFAGNFSFSSGRGDEVWLTAVDAQGVPTGYRQNVKFGPQFNGVSFGRHETSVGPQYPAMASLSFGSAVTAQSPPEEIIQFRAGTGGANGYPRVGPVIISEIMYHPAPIDTNDNVRDEYIELHNPGNTAVPLYDPLHSTNGWKLRDAVDFTFSPQHSILPGEYLVLVSFDPATNGAALAAFRAKYNYAGPIAGPYSGKLDNGGETVKLLAPDAPQTLGADAGLVPYVVIDQVAYSDDAPWPALADGLGPALRRVELASYGNEPANWMAAEPSLGTAGAADTDSDGIPDDWEDAHSLNRLLPDAGLDPDQDGFTNLQEYLANTDPQAASSRLAITAVTPTATGTQVSFAAAAGRSYSLLYRDQLRSGSWLKLTDIPALPAAQILTITDSSALLQTERYYRLVTPAIP